MKLLLVDDDPDFRSLIEESAPPWIEVLPCSSSRQAVSLLDSTAAQEIEFSVIDLCMEPFLEQQTEREGVGLIRWMARKGRGIPSILVSADERALEAVHPTLPTVIGCLTKPVDLDRLYRFFGAFRDLFGAANDQENQAHRDRWRRLP